MCYTKKASFFIFRKFPFSLSVVLREVTVSALCVYSEKQNQRIRERERVSYILMESVARCRRPNKASATLSNNNSNNNGGGFSGKSLYDDVYGGPPKFGVTGLSPRFEDYGEIFGSFHTARVSSIPLLDLPAVHEAEAFFDPRSNGFNYTEVFGALDFAVSHDNLFHQPTGLGEEAW